MLRRHETGPYVSANLGLLCVSVYVKSYVANTQVCSCILSHRTGTKWKNSV